ARAWGLVVLVILLAMIAATFASAILRPPGPGVASFFLLGCVMIGWMVAAVVFLPALALWRTGFSRRLRATSEMLAPAERDELLRSLVREAPADAACIAGGLIRSSRGASEASPPTASHARGDRASPA